jgi:tRNA A37 threonylcarbamoyladenosine dehydratase
MAEIDNIFQRTEMLLGKEAVASLSRYHVAVFGVGGVGGYVVEVLARSGVGSLDLYDSDVVNATNINRQIIATTSTLGRYKVDVAAERVRDINPACRVQGFKMFYVVANADEVDLSQYDYVVDCIDTVSAKMELVRRCTRLGVPIICSMGAANKLDATAFRVADISKTDMDPLARIMRKKLRKEGIEHFKCVYSEEKPLTPIIDDEQENESSSARPTPASNAWVPAAAGLILGGEVVLDLISK